MKITERKSISVYGGNDVEYGGNNNAAESTAIFTFIRTGNIDEALTFSFTHVQSGETATRTFKAGQSEFFNAHWAVDVDESNNPVCLITWTIVEPRPRVHRLPIRGCRGSRRPGHDLPAGHVAPAPLAAPGRRTNPTAMTMQNLIPEFGIRSAAALALAALAVVAALLAVGSPASAQSSDDGEEIWSSTMTVGSFIISKGYTSEGVGIGSLSDDSFILGRHTFEVSLIYDRIISSQLYVGFGNRQANDGEVRAMTLHIGGQTFSFEDATYANDPTYGHTYEWFLFPSFGWADNDEVDVKITALPMVNVSANGIEAEYKDTVEFEFSRIGECGRLAELHPELCARRRKPRRARSPPGRNSSRTSTGPPKWTRATTRSAPSRGRCWPGRGMPLAGTR